MINLYPNATEILHLLPFITLYAELHFRFKWMGSLYYQNEPEILADTPYRIEPGLPIPILLLIKDSHLYPIKLHHVTVHIFQNNEEVHSIYTSINQKINKRWWDKTILIDTMNLYGNIKLNIEFYYSVNGQEKHCTTHNFPQSNSNSLNCYISNYTYPKDKFVQYGDLHYHTNLTEDMVEYGAPLRATLIAAQHMGLDFYCTTDHSYDLDDKYNSWRETDPNLRKWKNSRQEIIDINNEDIFSSFIIPSEELTLHNHMEQNVHALILNNSKFLSGNGDGAEKYFNFDSQYNTADIYNYLENNAICIAAHPFEPVSFLRNIFFKRGKWHNKDIMHDKLAGFQIINGEIGPGYYKGIKKWIKLLLKGIVKYMYAGNDAHGNFNIYRQIKIPMISLFEGNKQILGKFRTGVYADKKNDIPSVIDGLKRGNCFVSNGPLLNFSCDVSDIHYKMGDKIYAKKGRLNLHIISSPEFGLIKNILVIKGVIGKNKEDEYFTIIDPHEYEVKKSFDISVDSSCYFRCIIKSDSKKENIFALSNPIWFYP